MIAAAAFALLCLLTFANGEPQNKTKDDYQADLIPMSSVLVECSEDPQDSYSGYGLINDQLEHCRNFSKAYREGGNIVEYEKNKCEHLRVHGEFKNNKCVCQSQWKGPYCGYFHGCPHETDALVKGVCTTNLCQNGGVLAVGSKQIECICPAPWDGRYCDRLACFRMSGKGETNRWKNSPTGCICQPQFEGKNCERIISCKHNGTLVDGRCTCQANYYGEICQWRCSPGKTCGSPAVGVSLLAVLFVIFSTLIR